MRFVSHIAGEIYVIYIALKLAVDGKAAVSDAIVASTVGMWLQHDMKNLLEQVPKLFKIMKPVYRVSSLLACKPRIEQDPACPDPKLLRPKRFQGHIEFRDVTFSYPKERQKQVTSCTTHPRTTTPFPATGSTRSQPAAARPQAQRG